MSHPHITGTEPASPPDASADPLPGRDAPLGNPGGSTKLGPAGADTALVQSWPALPA